ncbi:hypothetical protein [uncultured Jatrophihabitans sp.]|uniref:hypothetical protein n=1 Tax=uncultured Jatrophihabitans sp. TaxID=1610747 RepID=UPI0035CB3FE4
MSHSWEPGDASAAGADGPDADDADHRGAAAADGADGADDGQSTSAGQYGPPPGPYQRPVFGTADPGQQYPIPPQSRDEDSQGAPAESARGVTSGAPVPPGPFFAPSTGQQQQPTPAQGDQAPAPAANWEPPPRVDWRPEPAPSRGGRRRRPRGEAARTYDAPSQHPYAGQPAQAQPPYAPPPYAPQQDHGQQQDYSQQQDYGQQQPVEQQPPQGWVPKSQQAAPDAQQQPAPAQQQPAPAQQQPTQQSAPAPTQQPGRMPRPEDLLAPNVRPTDAEPASWGWRGRVNRGSGGLIKPKASDQELAVRGAIERIQYGFARPKTVVVVQPKGGAGKTPTTICLASAFGAYRGGYVVGWDDNETRGTLAVRVANTGQQTSTVWDLLGALDEFERFDARVGDLGYYVRAQPDAHFDALVSDDHPGNMSQIGEDEFHRLHTVLGRFYRMIVVDTGNNVRSPNWQAAVNAADLVVVVSSYQRDVGYSGSWVLDHLAQTGREELARNAVTVLTAADPTPDKQVRNQLLEHFRSRTRAVAEIPYDSAIAHGGPIRWTELAEATRNAWTLAAATVVDALAEQDRAQRP